jgi:hypothetical protein
MVVLRCDVGCRGRDKVNFRRYLFPFVIQLIGWLYFLNLLIYDEGVIHSGA